MKAEANSVARQYAEAVLDIAYKAHPGAADVIYNDIKLVNSAFSAEPDLGLVIGHPSVPSEEKRKVLVSLFQPRIQELTLRLLELLLDKRRIYIMPALETEFHALLNARKNIVSASLTSADRLSDNAVADIKARLTEHLGSSLELDVKVDPTLLGGVVLKLGDQVIDGSLKGEISQHRKNVDVSIKILQIPKILKFGKYRNRKKQEKKRLDEKMAIRPDEITSVLKAQLEQYRSTLSVSNVGSVLQVGDGIARVYGMEKAMAGELVEFEDPERTRGMVLNLEEDNVGIVILGEGRKISEGMNCKTTGQIASTPVGEALLGRIVNPIGLPLDGKGPIAATETSPIEVKAPGIVQRKSVHEPLMTGITAIDGMIPIGRGQRELIIGDRQTGKTAIAIDAIINQKTQPNPPVCIYVAIGQKDSNIGRIQKVLEENGAMEYTVIVDAPATAAPALQFLAPYTAAAIAEYFMRKGMATLCVYDDLSKHAQAYRAMSLLLRRPPGREAYPGDVFYLHSRLLERAAKLSDALGGGSMTALPIIETQAGDVSAYIPTNVISITDGQIFLETDLFYAGVRPAINAGISVSRVGGAAQSKAMKTVAGKLRLDLAQFRELEAFSQFASDLDKATQDQIRRGTKLTQVLKQPQYQPLLLAQQVSIIFAANRGVLDNVENNDIQRFKTEWFKYFSTQAKDVETKLNTGDKPSPDDEKALYDHLVKFKDNFFQK